MPPKKQQQKKPTQKAPSSTAVTPKKQVQSSITAYATPVSLPKRKVDDRDPFSDESDQEEPSVEARSPSRRVAKRISLISNKAPPPPPLTSEEKDLLRKFDLDTKFGPNIGITRLERWERAKKFSLNPPEDIHDILTLEGRQDVKEIRESIWHEL
ncbi:DNA polymerase delta subunit 4 [Rhizoclosmatium sp. JEL0117]|nr:DNA polymerase delta subunit 4 [Rhizoclosmatium sp. JEL0117]